MCKLWASTAQVIGGHACLTVSQGTCVVSARVQRSDMIPIEEAELLYKAAPAAMLSIAQLAKTAQQGLHSQGGCSTPQISQYHQAS